MQEKIPFAQFIANDPVGASLGYSFMDRHYIYRSTLKAEEQPYYCTSLNEMEDRDDWMFNAGWTLFGYYAKITRGPDRLHFTVRGKDALALLLIQDRLFEEQDAKNKAWKQKEKQKTLDAQWWP